MRSKTYPMTPCASVAVNKLGNILAIQQKIDKLEGPRTQKRKRYEKLLETLEEILSSDGDAELLDTAKQLRVEVLSDLARLDKEDAELLALERELAKAKEENEVCEHCCGTGKVFRRMCAEDEGDYYSCPLCGGTGVNKIKG